MIHRPVFKPHYLVKVIENEGVFLLSERHQTVLQGWLYEVIAPRLDGRPVEDLCAELRGRVMPAQVYYTLNQLEKKGYIAEGSGDAATMPPGEAALWSMLRVDPGEAAGRLARSTVALTVFGDVDIEPFRALLGALRVRVAEAGSEEVGLGVVVTDHYLRDGLQPYNKEALRTGRPWLLIKPVGTMVWIGPLFRPGITGCWECLAERIRANFPILGYLDGKRVLNGAPGADRCGTPATEAVAWGLAANAVASWIAQGESPQLEGRVQTFDALGWRGESHALVRHPTCPSCGTAPPEAAAPDQGPAPPRVVQLTNRKKAFTDDGGHRAVPPRETLQRFGHHVSPISGVVPMMERAAPDNAGEVMHVYVSGPNIARGPRTWMGLRTDLRNSSCGKGTNEEQARASALCEGIERYSAIFRGDEPRFTSRLVDPGWMAAQPGARLSTFTTADVAGGPGAWTALERFHQLVARCAEQNRRKAMSLERERLHLKAESEKRLLRSTLSRLAAVVEPERDGAAIPEVEEPPLVTACRLVGGQLGMLIQDPGRLAGKGRGSDPVAAVARASHLRTRRVLLSGPWWRRDNGPLLGFRSADEHPVALLPVSPSGYELIDPVAQTRDPVTAAVASEVRSFGYTFYRPFPPRALTLWDVMRLGFSGGVRDVLTVVLVGTVGGLLGMLPPIVMGWIFDTITPGLARSELIPILFALGFGAMAAAFLRLVQGVAILRVQTRAEGAVEAGLWDRLLNLPASFFRVYSSGDLATRAMGISAIRQVLTEVAWTTLVSLLFSLVSFGLLIVYDARLAVLTATLVTALFAVTILTSLRQLRYERGLHDQRGRIAGLVLQMVSGISRLRVAAAESRALALWAGEFSKQRRLAIRSRRLADNLSAFDAAASVLATLVLYATVARAAGGGLSLGKFLAFNAAFAQILAAVAMISANAGLILQVVPLYRAGLADPAGAARNRPRPGRPRRAERRDRDQPRVVPLPARRPPRPG